MTIAFAETEHGSSYTFTRPGKPAVSLFGTRGAPFNLERAKANAEYWWAK